MIDFSKPVKPQILSNFVTRKSEFLWNGDYRYNRFKVNVGLFTSNMCGQDFEIFMSMNNFLISLTSLDSLEIEGKGNADMKN